MKNNRKIIVAAAVTVLFAAPCFAGPGRHHDSGGLALAAGIVGLVRTVIAPPVVVQSAPVVVQSTPVAVQSVPVVVQSVPVTVQPVTTVVSAPYYYYGYSCYRSELAPRRPAPRRPAPNRVAPHRPAPHRR